MRLMAAGRKKWESFREEKKREEREARKQPLQTLMFISDRRIEVLHITKES